MPSKQKSGLYRSKVKIGVDANGKNVYKWISGKTKRELEQRRQDVIATYIEGKQPARDVLFGAYAQQWFELRAVGHLAHRTALAYRSMLNTWFLPALGDMTLRAISAQDIQSLINSFPPSSARTIQNRIGVLRAIFKSAIADKLISFNPAEAYSMPKTRKPIKRRALTERETEILLSLMDDSIAGRFIALLYYLGVRHAEAGNIKWDDVDFVKRTVHIDGTKTSAADRYVPMPDALYDYLLPLRQMPGTYIIHLPNNPQKPLHPNTLGKYFLRAVRSAGVDEITPHYLRHNYITLCWRNDIDVMIVCKIVGHVSPATTQAIYTDLTNSDIEARSAHISEMFVDKVAKKLHNI